MSVTSHSVSSYKKLDDAPAIALMSSKDGCDAIAIEEYMTYVRTTTTIDHEGTRSAHSL